MSNIINPFAILSVLRKEKNNSGAAFTIKSLKSGKDYTYKISRSQFKNKWYTHIKVETGYLEFIRLGTYYNGVITHKNKPVSTPAALAIAFVLNKCETGDFDFLNKWVEVMHLGKCISCGRTLTDANSISRGLGDVCAGY